MFIRDLFGVVRCFGVENSEISLKMKLIERLLIFIGDYVEY